MNIMRHTAISARLGVLATLLLISGCSSSDEPKPEPEQLPNDFSFGHETWIAGVTPSRETFVRIAPVEVREGTHYVLTAGTATKQGGKPDDIDITVENRLTTDQCLEIYNRALRLGFFKLKDSYSEEGVRGGRGSMTYITAKGVTKSVRLYARELPEIKQLVAEVQNIMKYPPEGNTGD